MRTKQHAWARIGQGLLHWFDSSTESATPSKDGARIDWLRVIPYVLLHVGALGVFWVGVSPVAVIVAITLYWLRMFAITAFYHRYFSHRSFETSRLCQFLFASLGAMAVQRGPCWWAAHHRDHHRHTESPEDVHSPKQHGFWWSHVGWFLTRNNFGVRWRNIPDLAKFPELRFLDRFDVLMPLILAGALVAGGAILAEVAPQWGTNGLQLLVWGFFVSTVALHHASFTVNSVAHTFGSRRFATNDDSRNNALVAFLTLGEGWHNNHHQFQASSRQGLATWEWDPTYWGLLCLTKLGVIWNLTPGPSARALALAPRSGRR